MYDYPPCTLFLLPPPPPLPTSFIPHFFLAFFRDIIYRVGGVDTFKSSRIDSIGIRQEVIKSTSRIMADSRAISIETSRIASNAKKIIDEKRDHILKSGAIEIARAALEARQSTTLKKVSVVDSMVSKSTSRVTSFSSSF